MSTIRKIGILVSIFWLSMSSLNAETLSVADRYSFSLSPLLGALYGKSEEIVYKYPGQNQYLSQLLWDLKPLWYAGLAADFGPRDPYLNHGFIADGSVKIGLPFKTGIIEDRDWNNTDNSLTNYSRHDAYSHGVVMLDLSAGYSWSLKRFATLGDAALSVYGELSYMYFSWSAENGYTQYATYYGDPPNGYYGPWSNSIPKTPISGRGILYVQNWFVLSPGISFKAKISRLFSLDLKLCYSPLIYCADKDDHLIRDLTFWDYCYWGNYLNGGAKVTFSLRKNLDLSLAWYYRYIDGPRGLSYEQQGSGPVYQTSNDGSGAGYSTMDVELALRILIIGRERNP